MIKKFLKKNKDTGLNGKIMYYNLVPENDKKKSFVCIYCK